jgi:hypothetical protein
MDGATVGRLLLVVGLIVAACGGWLMSGRRLPFGSLPGDISFSGGSTSVSFPIVTCIVISVALTVILNLVLRR